jgi:cytochrome P450
MKPSDFPRDLRFRTPGPAFIEGGMAHLRSYVDVRRAALDDEETEFAVDGSYYLPQDDRVHVNWYFMWATGARRANGTPGRHDVLRGLVESWFRSRAVTTLNSVIERLALALVRGIIEKGTGELELASELAYNLPHRTICAMVGFPVERERWIRDQLAYFTGLSAFEQVHREPAELEDYLWEIVRNRQAHPRSELLDLLIAAWREQTITDLELLGYVWGFLAAGIDTTGTSIANAFCLLGEFGLLSEARSHLDDEEWLRRAIEEVLRFATPFPAAPRFTLAEVPLGDGQKLPAHTPVQLWYSAANRDQAVNGGNTAASSSDDFDVTRSPNQHLAFGTGAHHCLGVHLARCETLVALRTVLRYLPGLEFDTTKPFERRQAFVDEVIRASFGFDQREAETLLPDLTDATASASA